MKRVLSLLVFALLLVGCNAPEAEIAEVEVTRVVEVEVTRIVEVEIPVEVTRVVEMEVTRVVRPTATPRPPATATPDAPEIGTRENPVPLLTPIDLVRTGDSGDQSVTITVQDVIRGDEAWQMAAAANSFNDPPPDGSEFLLALVEINFREGEGVLELNGHDTALINNNRIIEFGDIAFDTPCCIDPPFDFQLFPGGLATGWLPLMLPVDDAAPVLLLGEPEDGVYFSLVE